MNLKQAKKTISLIERKKKALIQKAKRTGLYENFGKKEIYEIKNTCDVTFYGWLSEEEKNVENVYNAFIEWCMSYNG